MWVKRDQALRSSTSSTCSHQTFPTTANYVYVRMYVCIKNIIYTYCCFAKCRCLSDPIASSYRIAMFGWKQSAYIQEEWVCTCIATCKLKISEVENAPFLDVAALRALCESHHALFPLHIISINHPPNSHGIRHAHRYSHKHMHILLGRSFIIIIVIIILVCKSWYLRMSQNARECK